MTQKGEAAQNVKRYNTHIPGVPHGAQHGIRGFGHGGLSLGGRLVPGPCGRLAAGPGRGQAPLPRQRGHHASAAHGFSALSGGDPVPGLCVGQLPSPLSAPAQPEPVQPPGPPPVALGRGPAPARGRRPGGHPRLPLPAGHRAAARRGLQARQEPQRFCGHGRVRGVCQPQPEGLRIQAGPALHPGGHARGL